MKGIILRVDARRNVSPHPTPQYLKSYYLPNEWEEFTIRIEEAVIVTKVEADSLITNYNRATEATWIMSVHQ